VHARDGPTPRAARRFWNGGSVLRNRARSKPEVRDTCYWLNNNLGYSLLQLDRPREATAYLDTAVAADPGRPNAYENLGLAHSLLGDFARAAECFVVTTQVNAADPRSVRHLEELVEAHPGLLARFPTFAKEWQPVVVQSSVRPMSSLISPLTGRKCVMDAAGRIDAEEVAVELGADCA